MKLRYLSIAAVVSIGSLSAQNLIKNGDFDKPLDAECRFDASPGVRKSEVITENLTWNKCLKMEVVKYTEDKSGKKYYALVRFGGDRANNGFPVKPNTVYRYSIELKGDVNCHISAVEWTGSDYWKTMKKIKMTGTSGFKPSKDWTSLRGTFQTGPNATHAALGVSIWGEERYKNLPPVGGFILIDKINVEEQNDLLGAFRKSSAVKADSIPERKIVASGSTYGNFSDYKTGGKAVADTQFSVCAADTGLRLNIRCGEPAMNQLKSAVRENGTGVWKDDVVEIFFDPVKNDRALTQLVVSAGGGRWMGFGTSETVSRYGEWKATVTKEKDAWVIDAEIPYTLLGWEKRPAPGSAIGFNIARDRKASPREWSSFSFAKGSFHDRTRFGLLLIDAPETWFQHLKQSVLMESERAGAKDLSSKIRQWKYSGTPEKLWREAEAFRREIAAAKLGSRTFVLTETDPAADPSIPMLPSNITAPPEKITVRAAGNEYKALPLAITNLLDRPEEYRIVIAALKKNGAEENGLKSARGDVFPSEKIKLLRGVRMKDGDEKNHGLRFDALAPMDMTSTVVVMPKEATPVWAVFHTAGIKPGIYEGVIRVIPLGQRAEITDSGMKYQGPMLDLPFSFEVLPFALDKAPALPQFLFGEAYNRDVFRMLMEYGTDSILVNTWGIRVKFNKDGSVLQRDTEAVEHKIRELKKWAQEYGLENDLRIGIAYSAYVIFRDVHSGKQFKPGSPEWEKAWREYVKILEDIRKKSGIKEENYFMEIWDEPHAKDVDELILASKIAKEAVPSMNMMVTLAAWDVPKLEQLIPYISHWCLWNTKILTEKEYEPLVKQLRETKKNRSIYTCEVSMRLDLQKYYRSHPWTALAYDMDMSNMFQFLTYRYPTHDWKLASYGNIARMASGVPVSTIRQECLRIGNNDIKYMKKLADTLKTSQTKDRKLKAEAEEFLKTTPKQVGITMKHDSSAATQAREKAIDLTLKLMNP